MATKAKQTKRIKSSKKLLKTATATTVTGEVEEMLDITPSKGNKAIEIELPDPIVDVVDPDLILETEEDEDALTLDEEDVNPFGDKWEM